MCSGVAYRRYTCKSCINVKTLLSYDSNFNITSTDCVKNLIVGIRTTKQQQTSRQTYGYTNIHRSLLKQLICLIRCPQISTLKTCKLQLVHRGSKETRCHYLVTLC